MHKEAVLFQPLADQKVQCHLCHHLCRIPDGKFGRCRVRQNKGGRLFTYAYGNAVAANPDSIEKKPLYHFLPGSRSFSIATMGCNFACGFCQNWQISQIEKGRLEVAAPSLSPAEIVSRARATGCRSIAYTYTEPTIFFEYALDTARLAKAEGLANLFVTNGFMTRDALKMIEPYLDACNVDLKGFRDDFYRQTCKGRLDPVLDSIRYMKELGIWVEITTLVIPGANDDPEELADLAGFLAGVDPAIPWHISRFHPDYQFMDAAATPLATMQRAYDIGRDAGLQFIYLGNVPGESRETLCPRCQTPVIQRSGFSLLANRLEHGHCPHCGTTVPGVY